MLGCGRGLAKETANSRSCAPVASKDHGQLLRNSVNHRLTPLSGPGYLNGGSERSGRHSAVPRWPAASAAEGCRGSCNAVKPPVCSSTFRLSICKDTASLGDRKHPFGFSSQTVATAQLWPAGFCCINLLVQGGWQPRLAQDKASAFCSRAHNPGFFKSASQNTCMQGDSSIRSTLRANHSPDRASPAWRGEGTITSNVDKNSFFGRQKMYSLYI